MPIIANILLSATDDDDDADVDAADEMVDDGAADVTVPLLFVSPRAAEVGACWLARSRFRPLLYGAIVEDASFDAEIGRAHV